MNNNWKTSVTELLVIFRGALLSIIPWIEKAKIRWKEGEAYDDWDNIAEALYNNIVCSSLAGEVASVYTIAKYNFLYEDYNFVDFIGMECKSNLEKKFVFMAFQSDSSPFDSIKAAELDNSNAVIKVTTLKFDDLKFAFVKNIDGRIEVMDEIEIVL